jgi:hypothetical protein
VSWTNWLAASCTPGIVGTVLPVARAMVSPSKRTVSRWVPLQRDVGLLVVAVRLQALRRQLAIAEHAALHHRRHAHRDAHLVVAVLAAPFHLGRPSIGPR